MSKKVLKSLLIIAILFVFGYAGRVNADFQGIKTCEDCDTMDYRCQTTCTPRAITIDDRNASCERLCDPIKAQYSRWQVCVNECIHGRRSNANKLIENTVEVVADDQNFSCKNKNIRRAVELISTALFWLRIIAPVIIVVVGTVSFAKAIMSQDDNDIKQVFGNLVKKIILGAAIFVLPSIVIAIMKSVVNNYDKDSSWTYCVSLLK